MHYFMISLSHNFVSTSADGGRKRTEARNWRTTCASRRRRCNGIPGNSLLPPCLMPPSPSAKRTLIICISSEYQKVHLLHRNVSEASLVYHRCKADAVDRLLAVRLPEAECLVKRQSVWRRIERDFLSGEVVPKPLNRSTVQHSSGIRSPSCQSCPKISCVPAKGIW